MRTTTNQLVQLHNGVPMTSSLQVAQTFNRRHCDILRDIRSLECSTEFQVRNFASSFYISEIRNGGQRKNPLYYLTRDGFTFLVMGFTGKVAAQFKEDYINAFNAMEQKLRTPATNEREIMLGMKTYFDKLRTQTVRLTKELQQQYGVTVGLNDLCYSYSIDLNRSLAENIKALLPATHNTLIAGWYAAYDAERNRKKAEEAFRMRNLLASFASHIEGLGIRSIEEW